MTLDVEALELPVVARDADTIVLAKPAGLPAETRVSSASVLGRVRAAGWAEARLPHRLDVGTDGLQVVAGDAVAVERHNAALRGDRWAKRYVAVVEAGDDPEALLGTHRRHLQREGRRATVVRSGGRTAWQDHELVVDLGGGHWAVVVRLRTGRYHQVRALLADLGHPLVGDERYGHGGTRDGRPLLTHARLGGLELDGDVVTVVLPSVLDDPRAWPAAVADHLLQPDLQ